MDEDYGLFYLLFVCYIYNYVFLGGHVRVLLFNFESTEFKIATGDRIAQIIITKIETPEIEIVQELVKSERGEGGFGSTGSRELKRHRGLDEGAKPALSL